MISLRLRTLFVGSFAVPPPLLSRMSTFVLISIHAVSSKPSRTNQCPCSRLSSSAFNCSASKYLDIVYQVSYHSCLCFLITQTVYFHALCICSFSLEAVLYNPHYYLSFAPNNFFQTIPERIWNSILLSIHNFLQSGASDSLFIREPFLEISSANDYCYL